LLVGECWANFRVVIDDYIAACEQTGAAPEKPASSKLMLHVAPTVHAAALKAAARSGISLNKWAEKALSSASKKPLKPSQARAVRASVQP
jgi:predicted HicB family RNase H-like nuclease